jgi:hypothetical protein
LNRQSFEARNSTTISTLKITQINAGGPSALSKAGHCGIVNPAYSQEIMMLQLGQGQLMALYLVAAIILALAVAAWLYLTF